MKDRQKNYLIYYLKDLEERIESQRSELKAYANHTGISVGSIASIASGLAELEKEQRTICWTLARLGYYVEYENGHVKDIVVDEEE